MRWDIRDESGSLGRRKTVPSNMIGVKNIAIKPNQKRKATVGKLTGAI